MIPAELPRCGECGAVEGDAHDVGCSVGQPAAEVVDVWIPFPEPQGCRVTVTFRAKCPSCDLPFPLRDTAKAARADATEHDRIAHPPVAGCAQGPRPV